MRFAVHHICPRCAFAAMLLCKFRFLLYSCFALITSPILKSVFVCVSVCVRKVGSSEANPIFSNCCGKAHCTEHSVAPRSRRSLPRELLTGSTLRDKGFRKNIVKYNNGLCMASVHANWVSRGEGQSGFNPTVTPQGRIHHFLGALQPAPGRRPAFRSVYIHDTDFDVQSELRAQNFAGVDCALLTSLASMLNQHNTYFQSFMSLHELA